MIRARVFAICCGYEDADDLDDGERVWTDLRVWAYRGEIVLVSGEPRVGRTGWTSSRRADGCRPTVRCERPCERAARQLIRRKAPRHRRGGFEVELRIAMPERNEVVVDKSHADAPEREHALVAIREAFDAAVRQIENVMREFRGR
jgi:hypothetical protein